MAGVPDPTTLGLTLLVERLAEAERRIDALEAELARRVPRGFRVEPDGSGGYRFANDATGKTSSSGV